METKNKQSILKIPLLLLVGVILFSFGVSAVSAAGTWDNSTIYVSTGGNDTWDGLSPVYNTTSGPKKTITNATGTVAANGTVHIAHGTYNESGININQNMTITGENQDNTIINGQQSGTSIFTIANGITLNIANLTLTNNTAQVGGAIYNAGGNLTVTNSKLTGNTAQVGGAIGSVGNLTVTNSRFTDNNATEGGAILNVGSLTVTNSRFTDNNATDYGGAIFNLGNLTVTNSTLTGNNVVNDYGGAICNYGGNLTVSNSTLTDNTAKIGGAIYSDYGSLTVSNSRFTDNNATEGGGAILCRENLTVTNSTFTSNTANVYGGGAICNFGNFTVTNSRFTSNTANSHAGGAIVCRGNFTVTNSTLINNNATEGGAIFNIGDESMGIVHFNRIVGNGPNTSQIYSSYGAVDATLNWWGSNLDPSVYVSNGTGGIVNVTSWLVLNATVNPTSIMDGGNSTVTVDLLHDNTGTYHDPVNGHVPDGTPVTFTATNGNFNPTTTTLINGQAKTLFTANHAGTASINTTIDNQTITKQLTITPTAYLYLNTKTSKKNPTVGETFILTYKLSNNGPDNATNVTVSFQIPTGLEFVNVNVDNGTVTYNPTNRTITWNLTNVEVGDPYLYLTVMALGTGSYSITPTITSETFNRNTDPLTPFSINVQAQNNSNSNTVNAASTTKTVPMQTTGIPIAGLMLAILAVLGGILTPRKK